MLNFKKLGFGLANIAIFIFLSVALSILLNRLPFVNDDAKIILLPLIIDIVLIIINLKVFKGKLKEINKDKIYIAIKYYICGVVAMVGSNLIINFFNHEIPTNEEANRSILKTNPISSCISMILLSPINEEITFRGSFKDAFKNKYLFLIFTSLIFGLMHILSGGAFINFIPYAAFGFFLGMIYYETDNILLSIFIHCLHNLICILLLIIGVGL